MKRLIKSSGLTVDFRFDRKPVITFGTLDNLKRQGILNGYEMAVSIIEKEGELKTSHQQ